MPIYIYETIPEREADEPRQFEVKQSMKDAALTHDPESGLKVRRVIQGGFLNTQRWTKAPPVRTGAASHRKSCCGVSGCGPH